MNKLLLVAFLISNVLVSNAVFLKKSSTTTVNNLRNIQESEFGKRILDTIALQMNNKSPLSDVAKMLNDILANLKAQQVEANSVIAGQRVEAENTHNKLVGIQTACQANADDAEEQIGVLQSEIKALQQKIKQLGNQLAILAARDNGLDVARAQDKKDYENRQAQGPGVIAALDVIISKLQTITPTSVDGAFVELAKIGKSNPIAALLQVASTFSEKTLNSVVAKLQELSASITAAITNDEHNEAEAEAQYQKIKGEIAATIKHVTAAKTEAEATLAQKQNALALQQKRYAENTQCVADTVQKITDNTNKINKLESDYAAATEGRAAEIAIIQQVIEIVAKNKEQLQDYLGVNGF